MNDQNCSNCNFYGRSGECRRHAPGVKEVPHWQDLRQHIPVWPVMRPEDWCGDWQPLNVQKT